MSANFELNSKGFANNHFDTYAHFWLNLVRNDGKSREIPVYDNVTFLLFPIAEWQYFRSTSDIVVLVDPTSELCKNGILTSADALQWQDGSRCDCQSPVRVEVRSGIMRLMFGIPVYYFQPMTIGRRQ